MICVPVEIAPGAPLRPLSLEQYEQMVTLGVLGEDDRLELLDGLLVAVSPQGELHGGTIQFLTDWAYDSVDRRRFAIRSQLPLRCLPASEPEPDLALVSAGGYTVQHPSSAALVIEVSVSSLPIDLGVKRSVYARAGVGEYWVVRPESGTIRVHRGLRNEDYANVHDVTAATFAGATLDLAALPRA